MSALHFFIAAVVALALTGGMFLLCRPVSADTRSALVTTAMFFVGVFALTLTIALGFGSSA